MQMVPMSEINGDTPCVILAGGKGTRLLEETAIIPKPMLMVGDKPLLQHVMDIYIRQGVWNFIVPVGYRGEIVRAWFLTQDPVYFFHDHRGGTEFQFNDYKVTVVDTGEETMTGGRLLRLQRFLKGHDNFYFTYGDGVADVDLRELTAQHTGDTLVTLTAVHPAGRFGRIRFLHDELIGTEITGFGEKVESEEDWVNGGFAILSSRLLFGISGDRCNLEKDVYPVVAQHGFMKAYRHEGFWKCVDTLRDLEELRSIYKQENAPWMLLSPGAQAS